MQSQEASVGGVTGALKYLIRVCVWRGERGKKKKKTHKANKGRHFVMNLKLHWFSPACAHRKRYPGLPQKSRTATVTQPHYHFITLFPTAKTYTSARPHLTMYSLTFFFSFYSYFCVHISRFPLHILKRIKNLYLFFVIIEILFID